MIRLPKEKWTVSGGAKALNMACPCCASKIAMTIYKVGKDGGVFPSVCCPDLGCKFQDYVVLEGWNGEEDAD